MNIALEDAEVGAQVAERNFDPVGREQLQAYAQASGDLNPLHLDPAFARKAGFDDVIVHEPTGLDAEYGYRNRVELTYGNHRYLSDEEIGVKPPARESAATGT